MLSIDTSIYLWFGAYTLSLISFILSKEKPFEQLPYVLFVLLIGLGWYLRLISPVGAGVSLAGLALVFIPDNRLKLVLISALCLALSLHAVDGFYNARLFYSYSFGISDLPYKLYANVDKSVAALIILLAYGRNQSWNLTRQAWQWIIALLAIFFGLAFLIGAKVEFKFSELTLAFAVLNLITTCVAEEGFFRLVVQRQIGKLSVASTRPWLVILATALLFTVAHIHFLEDFEKRLFLIFIAGCLYGWIYHRFNLGAAIMLHFLVNLIHFIFFAYPATFSDVSLQIPGSGVSVTL